MFSANSRSEQSTYGDVVHSMVLTDAWLSEERGTSIQIIGKKEQFDFSMTV
jgi:hypothetical protein